MNRNSITVLLLLSLLVCVVMPATADAAVEEKIYSEKSEHFNVGYKIVLTGKDAVWTVWNSENECKVVEATDDNIDTLESFKEAVDKCRSTEGGDYLTYHHVRWWTYVRVWIMNLFGLPVEREIAERWADNANFHFDHL